MTETMIASVLHLDWETRSVLDLRKVGLRRYARDPSTDIWCAQWALGDGDVQLWLPGQPVPLEVVEHVRSGGEVAAHGYEFEHEICNEIAAKRYGWPLLDPDRAICTMSMALAMGFPAGLEDCARALRLIERKDMEGHALMMRMARPRSKPGVTPVVWWDEPAKLERLYAYCRQDVIVERELHRRLRPLSPAERRVWRVHFDINRRGAPVDLDSVRAAARVCAEVVQQCNAEMRAVTAGVVPAVTNVGKLTAWLKTQGVQLEALAKRDVIDLLAAPAELPPAAVRALQLRQEAGRASTAKFSAIDAASVDGRMFGMYVYHKAATGRFASRGAQVHNLVRDMPPDAVIELVHRLLRDGDARSIDALVGPPLTVLSRCLRSFFKAPDGSAFVGGDFSNIEGRGVAWFAGEEWKLEAFRAADEKRGPGIYELAYSRMFGVPPETVKGETRQVGKVCELAFGYQGGEGSFHTMGRNYNVTVSDAKAGELKRAWRAAHPETVRTWYALERAAIAAVLEPGRVFSAGARGREAKFRVAGAHLWLLLPSGRALCYPYPKLLPGRFGDQLTYMCVPSQAERITAQIIPDPMNFSGWARVATYGGALMNNVVQGFSRDLLAHVLVEAHAAQLPIVLHTHDDANAEVTAERAESARVQLEQIMRSPPAWASGLPVFAKCHIMTRYGKG